MPEDIKGEPLIYEELEDMPPPEISDKFQNAIGEADELGKMHVEKNFINQFTKDINNFIEESVHRHSETEDEHQRLNLMFDLYFFPFRFAEMERELVHQNIFDGDARLKAFGARSSQALGHAVYYASEPNATGQYIGNMRKLEEFYETMGKIIPDAGIFWAGVKGHSRGLKLLEDYGCRVYIPEYLKNDPFAYSDDVNSKDPYVPLNDNEVFNTDVRKGVDAWAIKGEHLFQVDFKGGWLAQIKNGGMSSPVAQPGSFLPDDFIKKMQANGEDPKYIHKVQMELPSSRLKYLEDDGHNYFNSYLSLREDVKDRMFYELNDLKEQTENMLKYEHVKREISKP